MWQSSINAFAYLRHIRLVFQYVRKTRRYPNVAVPHSAEEKFLWRKVFDANPLFTQLSDKLVAKDFTASRCPDLLIPETLSAGTDFCDIPEDLLSGPAVLKSNHASGQVIFLNGARVDRADLKVQTDSWLATPYGRKNGEWGYRGIDRKIFVERLIAGANGEPLEDFNVYVMNDRVLYTQHLRESYGPNPTTTRYDRDGNQLEPQISPKFAHLHADPPPQYPRIVELAEILGAGFDHIRCDFYLCGGAIYFCEMTFYAVAGFPFVKGRLGEVWKANWDIRDSWFLTVPQPGWRGAYARWLRSACENAAI